MNAIDILKDHTFTNKYIKPIKWRLSDKIHRMWFTYVKNRKDKIGYKFIGLRRSGNHAVINWMINQTNGATCFCNDLGVHYRPEDAQLKSMHINGFKNFYLFISYEDKSPTKLAFLQQDNRWEDYIGESKMNYNIFLLRDPFNFFASRYRWKSPLGKRFCENATYRASIVDRWKEYAYEFLGKTNFMVDSNQTIFINYNSWFLSEEYRKSLAHKMNLSFSDKGKEAVKRFGGGSSFDGTNFRQKGSELKVLERWKTFANDKNYRSIFADEEIIHLSHQIFGHIDNTEMLFNSSTY